MEAWNQKPLTIDQLNIRSKQELIKYFNNKINLIILSDIITLTAIMGLCILVAILYAITLFQVII